MRHSCVIRALLASVRELYRCPVKITLFNGRALFVAAASAVAAVALAVPAAAGSGTAAAPKPPASARAPVSMGLESAVGRLAAKSYGAEYGGMAVTGDQRQLTVYLTDPAPAVERALRRVAPAGTLVFRKTSHSMRQLNAIQSSLQGKWQSLVKSGIEVGEFGSNPLTGKEDIGVVNLTAGQAARLDRMYGAQALNIFDVTPKQADAARVAASRIADTPPFNGGDAIVSATQHFNGCTSGFGVVIGGVPRLLTAAHCYTVGTTVLNARSLGGTAISGSGAAIGTVIESALSSDLDSEVISAPGSDLIWTGPIGAPQRAAVSGVGTWAVGDQVCTSGAYGGEICGLTVQHVNYCMPLSEFPISFHLFCHLTQVQGPREIVGGDSGGPVFRFSGSALEAVGTVSGFNASGNGVSWFTGIYAILGQWGASLRTG
jgi:hypothetical protein